MSLALLATLGTTSPLRAEERTIVAVETVKRGTVERTFSHPGTLDPYEKVRVYARLTGYAREVRVDLGDEVAAGEILVEIDRPEQDAKLRAARAELAVARAGVERAEAQARLEKRVFELTRSLFEEKARNRFDLARAEAALELATAERKLAEAREAQAKAREARVEAMASYREVRAPFAGVVTRRWVDTGALVREGTSSASEPLFEVERTDQLRVRFEVPELEAPLLLEHARAGDVRARVVLDARPEPAIELAADRLAGGGLKLSRSLHPTSHHMVGEIVIANPPREGAPGLLISGLFAKVTLELPGARERVVVRNAAIRTPRGRPPFAFVVGPGEATEARVVRVRLGPTDGVVTEVLDGLEPGDRVVVEGAGSLRGGQSVLAVERGSREPGRKAADRPEAKR